jgi:hypothetical protein
MGLLTMTAPNLYRWVFTQNGANSTAEMQFVHGTDVVNSSVHPMKYGADDEFPWNCKCQSRMQLMEPERLTSREHVNCAICVKPSEGVKAALDCESAEATALVTKRATQGILLTWITPPYWETASPGDVIGAIGPCGAAFSYTYRGAGTGAFNPSDIHSDWAAVGLPSFDERADGCGVCGRIAVYPPTGWLPGSASINGYSVPFASWSDGWGQCGTTGNPFLIDVFGGILFRVSGPSSGYRLKGEWFDLP